MKLSLTLFSLIATLIFPPSIMANQEVQNEISFAVMGGDLSLPIEVRETLREEYPDVDLETPNLFAEWDRNGYLWVDGKPVLKLDSQSNRAQFLSSGRELDLTDFVETMEDPQSALLFFETSSSPEVSSSFQIFPSAHASNPHFIVLLLVGATILYWVGRAAEWYFWDRKNEEETEEEPTSLDEAA